MPWKRDAQPITASRLLQSLNCSLVTDSIRACLGFTQFRHKEAYFVVSITAKGPMIGVSVISTGKKTELEVYRDVRKEITDYWNIETNTAGRKPANSQFDLAFIHTAPIDGWENRRGRIMLPSREDMELVKEMRAWVKQDHRVDTFPLCIEVRPYRDRTRAFILQEIRSHQPQSIKQARRAIGQVAKRHRKPVVETMAKYGFDLLYADLARGHFKVREAELLKFEYLIDRYFS